MGNTLEAVANFVESTHVVGNQSTGLNKANRQGETLEMFVRRLYAPLDNLASAEDASKLDAQVFSYLGNQNNPPDLMLRGGDAIEVKKVEGAARMISLNSSHPKQRLESSSRMLTEACRKAESWKTKDFLYVIGELLPDRSLRHLWMIYGDCYAAQSETYQRVQTSITDGLRSLNLELAKTNELGRVNGVDPLGVSQLRVRGMWQIAGPKTVFEKTVGTIDDRPSLFCIMQESKFLSFPRQSRERLQDMSHLGLIIKTTVIPSPDNPAELLNVRVISWTKKD